MRQQSAIPGATIVLVIFTLCFGLFNSVAVPEVSADTRTLGLKRCEPGDYRSSAFRSSSGRGLPVSCDLTLSKLPVGDQGRQGSCAGWAVGYYYKTYQEYSQHQWDVSQPDRRFSPSWLYNQACGGKDGGTTFPRVFEILKGKGIVDLKEFPYSDYDFSRMPTSEQEEAAKPYQISDYAAIWISPGGNNINAIKAHLASGDPVVLGIPVYDSFYNCRNGWIDVPQAETCYGGHVVCAVGYDNAAGGGRGGVKIVNSWGTEWGYHGYAYLSYDFITDYAWEAWVMTDSASDLPVIAGVSPQHGSGGSQVTISGDNFGSNRGQSRVSFSGESATIIDWNNDKIKAIVPGSAVDGNVMVWNWASEKSNGVPFDVGISITSINPEVARPVCSVSINGKEFGNHPGRVEMGGRALEIISWADDEIMFRAPAGICKGKITVSNEKETTCSAIEFRVAETVLYFAEGCTNWPFEEWICIQNPENKSNTVEITYMTPDGRLQGNPVTIPPSSRATVSANLEIPDADVSTRLVSDGVVFAERTMYWYGRGDGHVSGGIPEPQKSWYMAEGTTAYGFDTWILIQNASSEPADVNIKYYTPAGPIAKEPFTIKGDCRISVHANNDVSGDDISIGVEASRPVVVERSMYWDGMSGGHNSSAAPARTRTWYLAEGSTSFGFDEWVTIGNPSPDEATVQLSYLTAGGNEKSKKMNVPPESRRTVHVNEDIQAAEVSVVAESDRPLVVERSMYWNNGTGKAGHGALGATQPSHTLYLAEGCTAFGFDEWVLIENPSSKENTTVSLTYMTPYGSVSGPVLNISPMSRKTVHVNNDVMWSDVSVEIKATNPVIVERAMYWAGQGGGHNSLAVSAD